MTANKFFQEPASCSVRPTCLSFGTTSTLIARCLRSGAAPGY